MKKMNNKGFMLTETLIVSTLIITVLLVVYIQFKSINRKINNSYNYDTVSSLYNLYNVKLFIEQENYSTIVGRLDLDNYIDITDCSSVYFNSTDYCKSIISNTGITKLVATKENLYSLIEEKPFDEKFNDYISTISYSTKEGYRLIALFSNGTYASIRILNDEKFDSVIANACVLSVEKNYTINYLNKDGTLFKEPYKNKMGCTANIALVDFNDNTDSCYYVDHYSSDTLTISGDESLNVASIYYAKYSASLTIHYQTESGTSLSSDVVLSGDCGATYYPEQYKKKLDNYNYSRTSATEITLSTSNVEVILYYNEGSGSGE